MDTQKIIIREMKDGEQKSIVKVGKRAFQFVEALFVGTPKHAMVAEYEGTIIGAIMYKYLNTKQKKIIYIDEAFVDPDYHGMGVGKRLYAETFQYLKNQGCDAMTGLVKDDNIGSWKLFMDNGFQRVSQIELLQQLGLSGTIKQYLETPAFCAIGMDFYLLTTKGSAQEKKKGFPQLAAFFLTNLFLLLPLWIKLFNNQPTQLIYFLSAYLTVMALFILPRCIGALFYKEPWHFRFNNAGGLLPVLLSLLGNIIPMNANWYPDKYENTTAFKRKLAIPELCKWVIFSLLPLLSYTTHTYTRTIAQISCYFLVFSIIPLYPFESLGAGRIYRYNKLLWLITAIITAIELFLI